MTDLRTDRIFELSAAFGTAIAERIGEITSINRIAKMLSLNALVVAARAGEAGRGFSLVAEEFKNLSTQIDSATSLLERNARTALDDLTATSGAIVENMRRQRLVDLSLNAIEIIDRNLYERTCDVRWWATDSAIVDCVQKPSSGAARHAASRLRVILDAYTVYLDLWICDAQGVVVANGRPDRYLGAKQLSVADESWFAQAMALKSGDDFVAADIKVVGALGHAAVATYATAIREGGSSRGRPIGVLGIHFDWQPQAQTVVKGVRLSEEERERSRVLILDQNHRIIAASDDVGLLSETFALQTGADPMGSYVVGDATIGFARTPGYETYKGMGWYGCIVQRKSSDVGARIGKPSPLVAA